MTSHTVMNAITAFAYLTFAADLVRCHPAVGTSLHRVQGNRNLLEAMASGAFESSLFKA